MRVYTERGMGKPWGVSPKGSPARDQGLIFLRVPSGSLGRWGPGWELFRNGQNAEKVQP